MKSLEPMLIHRPRRAPRLLAPVALALLLLPNTATLAQTRAQAAHVHGVARLDVAVEAAGLTLQLEMPLDSLIGFERAPRTDAERRRAQAAVARLRDGAALWRIDPAARCTLTEARLESAVLGLGGTPAPAHPHDGKHDHGQAHGHADLEATYVFRCERSAEVGGLQVGLFDAFRALKTVRAQVAAPQGQFQRTLTPAAPRLSWGRRG